MVRPNMLIFKHNGVCYNYALTGNGKIMGAAIPFTNERYDAGLMPHHIVFASYNPSAETSIELDRLDMADDEQNFALVPVYKAIVEGKLQDLVYAYFRALDAA